MIKIAIFNNKIKNQGMFSRNSFIFKFMKDQKHKKIYKGEEDS